MSIPLFFVRLLAETRRVVDDGPTGAVDVCVAGRE
jgi:hypothetical protein